MIFFLSSRESILFQFPLVATEAKNCLSFHFRAVQQKPKGIACFHPVATFIFMSY